MYYCFSLKRKQDEDKSKTGVGRDFYIYILYRSIVINEMKLRDCYKNNVMIYVSDRYDLSPNEEIYC